VWWTGTYQKANTCKFPLLLATKVTNRHSKRGKRSIFQERARMKTMCVVLLAILLRMASSHSSGDGCSFTNVTLSGFTDPWTCSPFDTISSSSYCLSASAANNVSFATTSSGCTAASAQILINNTWTNCSSISTCNYATGLNAYRFAALSSNDMMTVNYAYLNITNGVSQYRTAMRAIQLLCVLFACMANDCSSCYAA
jgi:hypothetical protein